MEQCEKVQHLLLGEEEPGSISSAAQPVKRWSATKQQWWKHNSRENCFYCFSARSEWIRSADGSGDRCQSAQYSLLYRSRLGYVADPWSQSQDFLRWLWAEGHSVSQIQIGFAALRRDNGCKLAVFKHVDEETRVASGCTVRCKQRTTSWTPHAVNHAGAWMWLSAWALISDDSSRPGVQTLTKKKCREKPSCKVYSSVLLDQKDEVRWRKRASHWLVWPLVPTQTALKRLSGHRHQVGTFYRHAADYI